MGEGASSTLGPSRPPPHVPGGVLRFWTMESSPHGRGGLLKIGITEAPATCGRVPPQIWNDRGAYHVGEGGSSNLGSSRLLPHGGGGLLHFGTTEAPGAWVWGHPVLWDHRGPRRSNLGPQRPLPHGGRGPPAFWGHRGHHRIWGGLLRFGIIEAPAAWLWGPPLFCDHVCPRRMGAGASSVLGTPRPPPHWRGVSSVLGPPRPPLHG